MTKNWQVNLNIFQLRNSITFLEETEKAILLTHCSNKQTKTQLNQIKIVLTYESTEPVKVLLF